MTSFIKNIFNLVSTPIHTSKSSIRDVSGNPNVSSTSTIIEFNNESVLSLSKMLKQLLIKYKILDVKYPTHNFKFNVSDLYLKDIWFYEIYVKKHLQVERGSSIVISQDNKLKGKFEINLHSKLIKISY